MSIHSQNDLNKILIHFDLEQKIYSFKTLNSGFINDTYLVSNSESPIFILQRINHGVFSNVEGLMCNVSNALQLLKANDYTQIKLIKSKLGKTYFSNSQGFWRIMTYIKGSTTYDTTTSTEIAYEAGRVISRFHHSMQSAELNKYVDTIPKFHNLELRKMQFLAAISRASNKKKESANQAISFTKEMLVNLESINSNELPLRVCHNDTKLNNILFSNKTQKALCLIDLDTLMKGYFQYDFGDAIRTIVNTVAEDEQDHTKITFTKHLFEAFVDGLDSNGAFLSKKEIETMAYGVILMPFLHGIRALTDYLNGNIYYKVSYENQNLDRCLSLFNFTKKAWSNINYMKSTLKEKISSVD